MSTDTRGTLIDAALGLVRRHGYAAFSYADLAAAVGIRKPSIHHHFPSKEDLGVALVTAYGERIADRLRVIEDEVADPIGRVRAYATLYREGLPAGQGCLCGVLASELGALPPRIQAGVRQFFAGNLRWLEKILGDGLAPRRRTAGVARRDARTVLAALQGAMFVALSLGDPASFDQALEGLLAGLEAGRA
jgi:TetR/AcrR family transcriptional repressor of nem operon